MKLEFETSTYNNSYVGNNFASDVDSASRSADVSQMLQAGIKAAQAGNRAEARQLLVQVTEAEPENESAWLWLASISEYPEELLVFLNNILDVNPNNERALEWAHATKSLLAKSFIQRGVDSSNEANMDLAKQCFLQAIVHDSQNEMAWLWLASISDSTEEKISYLQKVLNINPKNETAQSSLQAARDQVAQMLLGKANKAAISGEHEAASEMLQEVLRQAPESEEAWILKSYLADSFSEKITCFEKVLALNPDNDAANSGLASLRAIMAKTENRKAQQSATIAELLKANHLTADSPSENAPPICAEINSPTQKLEFPPDFIESVNNHFEDFGRSEAGEEFQAAVEEFKASESAPKDFGDYSYQELSASPQPAFEENQFDEPVSAENKNVLESEEVEESSAQTEEESSFQMKEDFAGEKPSKPSAEMLACPFCTGENESNAFVCQTCRTVLSLSNLEMLLANMEADGKILCQAVERMEAEKSERDFEAQELKNLAIGHINLKHLRQGIMLLQAALRINPNDVMLGSQINSLKIRFAEIQQQESVHSSMTRGRTIMVVDDSATVRKLISNKLEKSGHEVLCAVDGIEALEKIKGVVPDLILLDINMPRMDGYQVCKLIRTNVETKDVPIVMISGNDGFFDKVRGRMSGTTGYITKPFGPETLMKIVESYII